MPRKASNEIIECKYFRWIVYQRGGIFCADGRAKSLNGVNLGRHSLGVTNPTEVKEVLNCLDYKIAKHRGYQVPEEPTKAKRLSLEEGAAMYLSHLDKPKVMYGVVPSTLKRYGSVFSKFTTFANQKGIGHWDAVNGLLVQAYADWLSKSKKYSTVYFEMILLKQVIKWLISQEHLPQTSKLETKLRKPNRSLRHCYSKEQVVATLAYCNTPKLQWLQWLIRGLIYLGLRIEELAALQWHHFDMTVGKEVIRLDDQSQELLPEDSSDRHLLTKNHRSRELPIHPKLLVELKERCINPRSMFVFPSRHGKPFNSSWARQKLVKVLEAVAKQRGDLSWEKDFCKARFHSFRNYFVTVCADAGVSTQMLMSWLGHQHSSMITRYYRPRQDVALQQMSKVEFE